MKKKILAVLLATGVAATTLLGGSILVSAADDGGNTAQARTLDEIKEDGKIKIGVFSDKNPFGYVDENGDVQGYDIYFGKRLAKDLLGSEGDVEFTYVEAASRVEYLQSAKIDVILANFTVTDERAEKVDFALPYMKVALGVVSPDDALITDVKDLEGKKLIVVKGTTAETYFTENYPDIELVKFDEYQEAYDALLDGRGDAFSTDNTEVLAWAQQNEGFSVGIESLGDIDTIAPAVQKGNTDLLNAINDEIKSLADEQFFHKDFEETLKPVYGDNIDPEDLVVEGGVVDSEETTEDADKEDADKEDAADTDEASDDTKDAETTEEPEETEAAEDAE
ncbi:MULTISPECIES: cysteine ABC transporter substrate-binding protein [unclassified Blautia]|uniref:cysteine ABC transporter substrate-binding protein n=1 Tax=unclassified Blautia TaxID=2648079 RepID=UPI003F8CD4EE